MGSSNPRDSIVEQADSSFESVREMDPLSIQIPDADGNVKEVLLDENG